MGRITVNEPAPDVAIALDELIDQSPRTAKRPGRSANETSGPLTVEPLKMREVALCILGASPLIYNRMSLKAQRELLLPAGTKNRAAKRAELKHDPLKLRHAINPHLISDYLQEGVPQLRLS